MFATYHRSLTVFTLPLLLISGCSRTSATKGNFQRAIQQALDANPACISVPTFTEYRDDDGQPRAGLDALAALGLMQASDIQLPNLLSIIPGYPKYVHGKRYQLTEKGKRTEAPGRFFPGTTCLAFGRKEVVRVLSYTEPADAMGRRVTTVSYVWKLTDVSDWAKSPGIVKAFQLNGKLSAASTPQQAQMLLVLSNDGWHAPGY